MKLKLHWYWGFLGFLGFLGLKEEMENKMWAVPIEF